MKEQRTRQQQRAVESLKEQLAVPDKDWPVIKPRVEKVYTLVHPAPSIKAGNEQPETELEQRSAELRELLRDSEAAADQITARLTALRTARQSLRQVMTLRQEAVLVLNGLLD